MKILNVTLYNISNYGAMLQAWALRHVLEKMGHEVVNLYYQKEYPGKFGWRGMLRSKSIRSVKFKLAVNKQMEQIEKEIGGWKQTKPYWSIDAIRKDPPIADCYLVGSDQMLRAERMRNFKAAVPSLLAFGPENIKRVGYAVSFGRPTFSDEEYKACQWAVPYLKRFSAVSVRESTGIPIMRKLAGVDAVWSPDPTLLLSKNDYQKCFAIPEVARKDVYSYMLAYCDAPQRTKLYQSAVRDVCATCNGKLHEFSSVGTLSYWLSGIANARYVITNSFHGTIFSINFNTPFISLGFDGEVSWRNDRAVNILEKFGLSDRFVMPGEEYKIPELLKKSIDWDRVNALHAEFAKCGENYLRLNV